MNPNRSTNRFTALSWLNIIQHGGTEDWKELYRQCHDPKIAAEVASVLALRDPDCMPSAQLWKFLIEDLHPQLKGQIDLHPERRHIGV